MWSAIRSRRLVLAAATLVATGSFTACNGSDSGNVIADPVVTGTIALTLTPGSVSVAAGGTGSVGLSVGRGGAFSGPVLLTASGVPAGVSVTFGSSTVASGAFSTSVNVTVAAGTTAATTAISIVGTGSGLTSPAATLTLRTL